MELASPDPYGRTRMASVGHAAPAENNGTPAHSTPPPRPQQAATVTVPASPAAAAPQTAAIQGSPVAHLAISEGGLDPGMYRSTSANHAQEQQAGEVVPALRQPGVPMITDWGTSHVQTFLDQTLSMPEHTGVFRQAQIDGLILPFLNGPALFELGMTQHGQQRAFVAAVNKLTEVAEAARNAPAVGKGSALVRRWGAEQVSLWMRDVVGLPQYASNWEAQFIDGTVLLCLDGACLQEMGVRSALHRALILAEIERLDRHDPDAEARDEASGEAGGNGQQEVGNSVPLVEDSETATATEHLEHNLFQTTTQTTRLQQPQQQPQQPQQPQQQHQQWSRVGSTTGARRPLTTAQQEQGVGQASGGPNAMSSPVLPAQRLNTSSSFDRFSSGHPAARYMTPPARARRSRLLPSDHPPTASTAVRTNRLQDPVLGSPVVMAAAAAARMAQAEAEVALSRLAEAEMEAAAQAVFPINSVGGGAGLNSSLSPPPPATPLTAALHSSSTTPVASPSASASPYARHLHGIPRKAVEEWSVADVSQWLGSVSHLQPYIAAFVENGVDGSLLLALDEPAFQELGMLSSLHRLQLQHRLRQAVAATPEASQLQAENDAATKVQAVARGRRLRKDQARQHQAATEVQRAIRGRQARRRAGELSRQSVRLGAGAPLRSWSAAEVARWFRLELGLPQHAATILATGVDGQLLAVLGKAELDELGVDSALERVKVLSRVAQRVAADEAAGDLNARSQQAAAATAAVSVGTELAVSGSGSGQMEKNDTSGAWVVSEVKELRHRVTQQEAMLAHLRHRIDTLTSSSLEAARPAVPALSDEEGVPPIDTTDSVALQTPHQQTTTAAATADIRWSETPAATKGVDFIPPAAVDDAAAAAAAATPAAPASQAGRGQPRYVLHGEENRHQGGDVSPADADLPDGWTTAMSRSTGQVYYINTLTAESTYERPTAPATSADVAEPELASYAAEPGATAEAAQTVREQTAADAPQETGEQQPMEGGEVQPHEQHARELAILAQLTAEPLSRTVSGRDALSAARAEMPPLGRTTSSMEERRTQLQELSAAASDLLAGAEIPQLGRTASSMEECRTQLQELRAAASNLIAGIGKGPGLEQTAAEAAILLEESRAMALEVAALKAQQSRAPSSEAKAAPTSNSGLVQAMKDVAAEAEEDRLFEEDRGSESLGAALARNKLLRQKQHLAVKEARPALETTGNSLPDGNRSIRSTPGSSPALSLDSLEALLTQGPHNTLHLFSTGVFPVAPVRPGKGPRGGAKKGACKELSWSGNTLAEGEASASQRLLMEELASMERLDRSDNSYGR